MTGKNASYIHVRAYLFGLATCLESGAGLLFDTLIRDKQTLLIGSTRPDHYIGDLYGQESDTILWVEINLVSARGFPLISSPRIDSHESANLTIIDKRKEMLKYMNRREAPQLVFLYRTLGTGVNL